MKQLFLALLFLASLAAGAQPTAWNYVLPIADPNGVTDVAADDDGNLYATGRFTGSLQLGATRLSSNGPGPCLYVAKCSPAGQVLRVTKLEGAIDVLPRSIAVDKAGNCYVTGSFLGTLVYNLGQQTITSRSVEAGSDVFLLKCGPGGSVRWVRQADGGQGGLDVSSVGTAVAVDQAGNSYITGQASGPSIRFETLTFGPGQFQGFVASYTCHGQLRWARVLADALPRGGFGSGGGGGIAVDQAGSCYLSGVSGRGWTLDGTTVPASPTNNMYLARFDAHQGRLMWAQTTPGQGDGGALATDKQGDVYLGGSFTGTVAFGARSLTSAGDADGFVARYAPTGRAASATAVGSPGFDAVNDLAIDPQTRKVVLTGFYNFTAESTNRAFLARLSPSGQVQLLELVGGPGTSSGGKLAIDGENCIYSVGVFTGSCGFGAVPVRGTATQGYLGRYGTRLGRQANDDASGDFLANGPVVDLFPNPAQSQFTVRLARQMPAGRARLYNQQGRVVAEHPLQPAAAAATDVAFDTAMLPDGLYLLRVEFSHSVATRLITVRH